MTGHVGGRVQAGSQEAASPEATTTPETEVTTEGGGGDDLRTDLDLTRPPKPGSAAVPAHPFPAAEPAPPMFLLTTRAPDGHVVSTEVVDHEELDERLPALLFVTEQLAGWSVTSEPMTST